MIHEDTVLGSRVRDIVSGFAGIITGRCQYLNGCTQFCISPPVDDKGIIPSGEWIDNGQLEYVDEGISADYTWQVSGGKAEARSEGRNPGGPQRDTPPT